MSIDHKFFIAVKEPGWSMLPGLILTPGVLSPFIVWSNSSLQTDGCVNLPHGACPPAWSTSVHDARSTPRS